MWEPHFFTPFLRYCGLTGGARITEVSEHEERAAYAELGPLEQELQTIIRTFHARTGALPVVGDELNVSNYYHYVPTEVRVARRLLFMPVSDLKSDVMEVIYFLDCDDIKAYK
jgi:hypothetical protein